jgi:hypothetical protein
MCASAPVFKAGKRPHPRLDVGGMEAKGQNQFAFEKSERNIKRAEILSASHWRPANENAGRI